MIQLSDIHSLTDFQRNTKEFVQRMKETGRAHGERQGGAGGPGCEVVSAGIEAIDRTEAIEGLASCLESMQRGEGRPAAEVLEEIRKSITYLPSHEVSGIIQPRGTGHRLPPMELLPGYTVAATARWCATVLTKATSLQDFPARCPGGTWSNGTFQKEI